MAVHEAGHALVAVLSERADPVAKVTILPRGAALGVTEQLPESERHLYPVSHLTDTLAVRLAGRAAEIIVFGEPSTGASNDLLSATELATRMVREWGFSAEVGPISYGPGGPSRDNPFAGRSYAEETQRSIDQEVARLLRDAETGATKLIRAHREAFSRSSTCCSNAKRSTARTSRRSSRSPYASGSTRPWPGRGAGHPDRDRPSPGSRPPWTRRPSAGDLPG